MQESSTPASQGDQSDEQAEPVAAPPPPDDEMAAEASAPREEHVTPSVDEADAAELPLAEGEAGTAIEAEAEEDAPAAEQAQGQPEESDAPDEGQEPQVPDEPDEPYGALADETVGPESAGQGVVDGGAEPAEDEPSEPSVEALEPHASVMGSPEHVPEEIPEETPQDIPEESPEGVPEYPTERAPVEPVVLAPHPPVDQPPAAPPEWSPTTPFEDVADHAPVAAPVQSSTAGLQVPWTLRQTLLGAGLTLIPWLVFAVGSQLLQRGMPQPAHPHRLPPSVDLIDAIVFFLLSSALEAVFLIAPLIYAMRTLPTEVSGASRWRLALRALGLRLPEPALAARAGVLAIAVILGASVAYSSITQALHLPLKTNVDTLLQQAKYAPYTVIGTLLVAVLVAPFCEEMFFRGFLFAGLARGMRLWVAVVLSAALFGLAHTDLGSFVVLFVIGIVLAVLRARTSSLWPGIAVHTLNNTIAFISILVLLRH